MKELPDAVAEQPESDFEESDSARVNRC